MSIRKSIGCIGVVLAMMLGGCVIDATGTDDGSYDSDDAVGDVSSGLDVVGSDGPAGDESQEQPPSAERRGSSGASPDDLYKLAEPDPEPWMHDDE